MKTKILALLLLLIGAIVACKKNIEENVVSKYSDEDLFIDRNSAFSDEERALKEKVMSFDKISVEQRKSLVRGLVMDNKHVVHILEKENMDMILKLNNNDAVDLFKILIPNKSFLLKNGKGENLASYILESDKAYINENGNKILVPPCDYWIANYQKYYLSWYQDHCFRAGQNVCMQYVDCP